MATFDPWIATFEEGLAYFVHEADISDEHMRWLRARWISARKDEILAGSGRDVLDAVAQCVVVGLPLASWLAEAFLERYKQVNAHVVASWDDDKAFGPPHPEAPARRVTETQLRLIRDRKRWPTTLEYYFKHTNTPKTPEGYEKAAAYFQSQLSVKQIKTLLPKIRRNSAGAKASPSELADAVPNWHDPFLKVQRSRNRRK